MTVIHNKHDYQFPPSADVGDIFVTTLNNDLLVLNGYGEWKPLSNDGITVSGGGGKSVAISVLDEWVKEQELEAKYPALAAAREQYIINTTSSIQHHQSNVSRGQQ